MFAFFLWGGGGLMSRLWFKNCFLCAIPLLLRLYTCGLCVFVFMWVSAATHLNPEEDNIYPPNLLFAEMIKLCHIHLQQGDGVLILAHRWCSGFRPHMWLSASPGLYSQRETQLPHGNTSISQGTEDSCDRHTVKLYKTHKALYHPEIVRWHKNWEHSQPRNYR